MTFNASAHPCVIIDIQADGWIEEVSKTSVIVLIIKVGAEVVISPLSNLSLDVTVEVGSGIGVEVLTDGKPNGLVAAVTASYGAMSSP